MAWKGLVTSLSSCRHQHGHIGMYLSPSGMCKLNSLIFCGFMILIGNVLCFCFVCFMFNLSLLCCLVLVPFLLPVAKPSRRWSSSQLLRHHQVGVNQTAKAGLSLYLLTNSYLLVRCTSNTIIPLAWVICGVSVVRFRPLLGKSGGACGPGHGISKRTIIVMTMIGNLAMVIVVCPMQTQRVWQSLVSFVIFFFISHLP